MRYFILAALLTACRGYAQQQFYIDTTSPWKYCRIISDSQMISPLFGIDDTALCRWRGDTLQTSIPYLYIGGSPDHWRARERQFIFRSFAPDSIHIKPVQGRHEQVDTSMITLVNLDRLLSPVRNFTSLRYKYLYAPYDTFSVKVDQHFKINITHAYYYSDTLHHIRKSIRLNRADRKELYRMLSIAMLYLPYEQQCPPQEIKEQLLITAGGKSFSNRQCILYGVPALLTAFLRDLSERY